MSLPETCELPVDYARLLDRYSGRWVAVRLETQDVVAVGDSPKEVLDSALAQGVESPYITKVDSDNYLAPCATEQTKPTPTKVAFSPAMNNVKFPLLGYLGFFDRFTATFRPKTFKLFLDLED